MAWMKKFTVDNDTIHPILIECRVHKNEEELKVMRASCKAAAESHVEIMKVCKPGIRESFLMSKMRSVGLERYNTKFKPYGDILASGINASTLHYVTNDVIIKENQLVLCDCGHMVTQKTITS